MTPNAATSVTPTLLMAGRQIHTTLPVLEMKLQMKPPERKLVWQKDTQGKPPYWFIYNHCHTAQPFPEL